MKKLIILSAIAISGFIYTTADAQQHNNQHSNNQRQDSYRQQSQPNSGWDGYGQRSDKRDRGSYNNADRNDQRFENRDRGDYDNRGGYDQRVESRDRGREHSDQNGRRQREDGSYGERSAQYSRQDSYADHR